MSSVCFIDWLFLPVFCVYVHLCEQVPKPCAHQCSNRPGSFQCVCPPGQHLLGDGKSCAALERLPNYGAQYNSYNPAQFSPMRNNHQPHQHYRQHSHRYSSYSESRKSRTPLSRTRRTSRKTCPEGSEAHHDTCVGKCQPIAFPFCGLTPDQSWSMSKAPLSVWGNYAKSGWLKKVQEIHSGIWNNFKLYSNKWCIYMCTC